MVRKSWLILVVFTAALWAVNDDYTQWLYYRNITLNTSASGANVTNLATKFPVLVRLGAADSLVFKNSQKNGQDVRFSKSTGVHFPYQIERWDSAHKAAEIWVLADSVKGNDSTQYMKMYWGNAAAADSQKSVAVFDAANGYQGVWHLNEATGATASDATINAYNATPRGKGNGTNKPADTTGIIGRAKYFNGGPDTGVTQRDTSYYILLSSVSGNLNFSDSNGMYMVSAWVNTDTTFAIPGRDRSIVDKGNNQYDLQIGSADPGNPSNPVPWPNFGYVDVSYTWRATFSQAFKRVWKYVVAVHNGTRQYTYVDGICTDSTIKYFGTGGTPIRSSNDTVAIGGLSTTKKACLKGYIDEVRIENTFHSANWIRLCYQNQQANQTLVILEPPPSALSYIKNPVYFATSGVNTPDTPRVTGRVDTFFTSSALPAGLSIDPKTGIISGVASGGASTGSFTVTAKNAVGSTQATITVTVYVRPSITSQPTSDTVRTGDTAIFVVKAGGTSPTYQWWKGGSSISGATKDTLKIIGVAAGDDSTIYRCRIGNAYGDSLWSASCVLRVNAPPAITLQPVSRTVIVDSSTAFMVKAAGSAPLTYQWTKNNTAVAAPAGTKDTLTLTAVPLTDDNTIYRCRVKNKFGDSLWSVACTLHVIALPTAPAITQQPSSQIVIAGVNAMFVVKAGGSAPLSYGWIRNNGIDTTWTTPSDTLKFSSVSPANDNTLYKCLVKNSVSFAVSTTCTLHVSVGPVISLQPVSQTVLKGAAAKFIVKATGSAPLSYQWTKNGQGISGAVKDTLSLSALLLIDDATIYKCRIGNVYGDSAWSAVCTLRVIDPPVFTLQPLSKTVGAGTDAAFTVQATGTPSPTYLWIRNTTDTIRTATAATLTLPSVQGTDDKSYYRCVARNAAGSVTSALCTLRVVSANFSATPLTGTDTLTVRFIDSSTGGATAYVWNFGDGDSATTANPVHKYAAPGTYTVNLTVSVGGLVASAQKADYIKVNYSKPIAKFAADTLQGTDSLTVHFTDQSKGMITSRKWIFGDGGVDTQSTNPVHSYRDTGSFTVKLIVIGPGGADSSTQPNYIFVYSKSDNPIRIKGQRISTSSVEIAFSNFLSIPTSAKTPLPPFADTVGLWFKRGGLPLSTQNDSVLKKYSLIQMQKNASGAYKDTVAVPYSAPAARVYYGFNTALVWNDRSFSPMKPGNGDSLLMQDTIKPANRLTLWGNYLGGDSAALYVDSVSKLDTARDSVIGLWYGFKDSANFSDQSYTRWFPAVFVIAKATGDRFSYIIHEPLKFTSGDTLRVYAALAVVGKNQLQSAAKDTSFRAGRVRPENPVRLSAKAAGPTSIRLTWREIGTGNVLTGVDSILIWSGTKPIPALNASAAAGYTALTPLRTDTALLKSGLNEKTRYYFGAQVLKSGLWSMVTDSASASDSTPVILDTARPANTIQKVYLTFDTTRNGIMVAWRMDAPDTNCEIGIAYSFTGYPADTALPPQQIVNVRAASDSAALALQESIAFDSTYYVSLWLRKKEGKWSLPTSLSEASIKLPAFVSWQTVEYFTKYPDTVTAFGGRVRLANDSGDITPTVDTLVYDKTPGSGLNGFVPVSIGFHFAQKLASEPFHIGIAFDTASIPKGYNAGDVRIYHDSAGTWFVERGTLIDRARKIAWVLTRNLDFSFRAMIDTLPPVVKVLDPTTATVRGGVALSDSFALSDNVANMAWSFHYAKGEDAYGAGDSSWGVTRRARDSTVTTIPGIMVNQNNGTRALFIVSDGVHSDTENVSRQVYCDSTLNVVRTKEISWFPLQVGTTLDSNHAHYVLRDLAQPGEQWYYDNTKFRLYYWYPYAGNSDSVNKWVEYSSKTDWIFTFDAGKLFWIKTRKAATINLGNSVTPSLRQPSPIVLAGGAVTDFSLPFGFNVLIGDILRSTDADTLDNRNTTADSLQIYSFVVDTTGRYRYEALYLARFASSNPRLADPADTIVSKGAGGYCIYNPYTTPMTLSVPPIPVSMSKVRGAVKKAKAAQAWTIAVKGQTSDGMRLSTVYCGHSEGKRAVSYYPAMPMFGNVGIRVTDEAKRPYGHAIAAGSIRTEGGVTFPLVFCNRSGGPQRIDYHVDGEGDVPEDLNIMIADPATAAFEDARKARGVLVADGAEVYRDLVVGTGAYLAKVKAGLLVFRLALVGAYPNPFARALTIRYTLPGSGLDRLRFSIIDISGRKIWEKTVSCGAASGARELVWNGREAGGRPVASGMYIVRMVAVDKARKLAGTFEKKITYLP